MSGEWAAIVTAAGASTRMGTHKALLPWGGRPLVAHQTEILDEAGFEPLVVTGAEGEAVASGTPSFAETVRNSNWQRGRSGSIETGAAAVADGVEAVLVVAVDQPLVPDVLDRLVVHAGDAVVQPVDPSGRPGHPVVLGGGQLEKLRNLEREPEGLRSLVRRLRPEGTMVEIEDLPHWDLNDPEAYGRARNRTIG